MTTKSIRPANFLSSPEHLHGCYGGIAFCFLVIGDAFTLSWFAASFWGYLLGRLVYLIKRVVANSHIYPISQTALHSLQTVQKLQNIIDPKPQQLDFFKQFSTLKYQTQELLPQISQEKLQDIAVLLVVLKRKIKLCDDVAKQQSIEKIQRIIHNYLTPSLIHYEQLPIIFHERVMEQGKTPNELLFEQLDLVYTELLVTAEYIFQDDLNALIDHGNFLEQKLQAPEFFKVGKNLSRLQGEDTR